MVARRVLAVLLSVGLHVGAGALGLLAARALPSPPLVVRLVDAVLLEDTPSPEPDAPAPSPAAERERPTGGRPAALPAPRADHRGTATRLVGERAPAVTSPRPAPSEVAARETRSAPPAPPEPDRTPVTEAPPPAAPAPSPERPPVPVASAPARPAEAAAPAPPPRAAPDPLRPAPAAPPRADGDRAALVVPADDASRPAPAPGTRPAPAPRAGPGPAPAGDAPLAGPQAGGAATAPGGGEEGPAVALARGRGGAEVSAEYGPYLGAFRRRVQEALSYPLAARRQRLEGSVELDVLIDQRGRVAEVRVARPSAHPMLDQAALEAVRSLAPLPLPQHLPRRPLRVRLPLVFQLR